MTRRSLVSRAVLILSVVIALIIGALGGFLLGRATVEDRKPASAPLSLEQRCDEAGGIWLDREDIAAKGDELLSVVPHFAHQEGCWFQINVSTVAPILDLELSPESTQRWARENGITQEMLNNDGLGMFENDWLK
jgi:hypothetical protein